MVKFIIAVVGDIQVQFSVEGTWRENDRAVKWLAGELLVTSHSTEWGRYEETAFQYDFSHLYEPESGNPLEIYILSYSWVDSYGRLYAGVCSMYIPAKVPPATAMVVQQLEESGDFRHIYFDAYGDGTLDNLLLGAALILPSLLS